MRDAILLLDPKSCLSSALSKSVDKSEDKSCLTIYHSDLEQFCIHFNNIREERKRIPCLFYQFKHGIKAPLEVGITEIERCLNLNHIRHLLLIHIHIGINIRSDDGSVAICAIKQINKLFESSTKYQIIPGYGYFSHVKSCDVSPHITYVGVSTKLHLHLFHVE